jgi:predicted PurR-regulated permease PerM
MNRSRQDTPTMSPLLWLAGIILILYYARAVLIPLALALTLNFLLMPMVIGLQRFRIRRGLAVALVMLISIAVVGGMGWIVAGQLL